MSHRLLIALALAVPFGLPTAASSASAPARGSIRWQPTKLVPGSPVLFQVSGFKNVRSISGRWFGHEVNFFRPENSGPWYGLAAVPLETAPGIYQLQLQEVASTGNSVELTQKINVVRKIYPKITAKVAKQFTEPNPEQLKEINADKEVKQQTFAAVSSQKLWGGPFVPPVSAAVSDVFGTERVFNKEVLSRHQGIDYAVSSGTPVAAINAGTVLLARPLYFEGNCVVIDHGQGLLSLYLHLSEFKVKEGDQVQAHQIIALSGGSGRATGPHLHLAVRWQGIYLDPAILLNMKIP